MAWTQMVTPFTLPTTRHAQVGRGRHADAMKNAPSTLGERGIETIIARTDQL